MLTAGKLPRVFGSYLRGSAPFGVFAGLPQSVLHSPLDVWTLLGPCAIRDGQLRQAEHNSSRLRTACGKVDMIARSYRHGTAFSIKVPPRSGGRGEREAR